MQVETREWLEGQKKYWESQLEQVEYKRTKGMELLKKQARQMRDARRAAISCRKILNDINGMLAEGDWEV